MEGLNQTLEVFAGLNCSVMKQVRLVDPQADTQSGKSCHVQWSGVEERLIAAIMNDNNFFFRHAQMRDDIFL